MYAFLGLKSQFKAMGFGSAPALPEDPVMWQYCIVQGARKIEFCHFKRALELIAEDKKVPVEQVHHKLLRSGGPRRNATQADFVRLHDDKSTFTGGSSQCACSLVLVDRIAGYTP